MKKVDEHTFKQARKWLIISTAKSVAHRFDLHESTVLNIRGSKNYAEYREMVKAEHPPVKYSLAEDVMKLHRTLFDLDNGQYLPPRSAQVAMGEILKAY